MKGELLIQNVLAEMLQCLTLLFISENKYFKRAAGTGAILNAQQILKQVFPVIINPVLQLEILEKVRKGFHHFYNLQK